MVAVMVSFCGSFPFVSEEDSCPSRVVELYHPFVELRNWSAGKKGRKRRRKSGSSVCTAPTPSHQRAWAARWSQQLRGCWRLKTSVYDRPIHCANQRLALAVGGRCMFEAETRSSSPSYVPSGCLVKPTFPGGEFIRCWAFISK
jgi:hypothetical protein